MRYTPLLCLTATYRTDIFAQWRHGEFVNKDATRHKHFEIVPSHYLWKYVSSGCDLLAVLRDCRALVYRLPILCLSLSLSTQQIRGRLFQQRKNSRHSSRGETESFQVWKGFHRIGFLTVNIGTWRSFPLSRWAFVWRQISGNGKKYKSSYRNSKKCVTMNFCNGRYR